MLGIGYHVYSNDGRVMKGINPAYVWTYDGSSICNDYENKVGNSNSRTLIVAPHIKLEFPPYTVAVSTSYSQWLTSELSEPLW